MLLRHRRRWTTGADDTNGRSLCYRSDANVAMSPKRQLQRHALEKMGRRRRKEDKTTPTVEPLHRNLDIPSAPLMPRTILDQMITMINPFDSCTAPWLPRQPPHRALSLPGLPERTCQRLANCWLVLSFRAAFNSLRKATALSEPCDSA